MPAEEGSALLDRPGEEVLARATELSEDGARLRQSSPLAALLSDAERGACMTRSELEHLIGAAGEISEDREIVVIGGQAILGQYPDAPAALLRSMEADVFPRNHPGRADLIDGAIGEGSRFHEQFRYYAQGVGESTATLPAGWREWLRALVRARIARDFS